jgi:neurofibromin 1
LFSHFKRSTQSALALALRSAIWSWIETFNNEFVTLVSSNRRLEGGPDVLFDVVATLAEKSQRRPFAWPLMTMLLVCCPDIMSKIFLGEGLRVSGMQKKVSRLLPSLDSSHLKSSARTGPVSAGPAQSFEDW